MKTMTNDDVNSRILVLGGARSGKSSWAENRLASSHEVDYLATSWADPDDDEWQARLAAHRERRPSSWTTIETLDLAPHLLSHTTRPLMIDCLTVWLTRVLDEVGAWSSEEHWRDELTARTTTMVDALAQATRPVIAVSNEVGQGIVPAEASTRLFRDEMGRLNAEVARVSDEVWFCTAGIANRLK